jgi:hypothetical protein
MVFGKGVSGGTGEDRHGQEAGAENSQRKHGVSEIAGDRTQRLRRLRRGLDVRDSVGVQGGRCRDDDEQRDYVR